MKDQTLTEWLRAPISNFAKTSAGGTPKKANKAFYEGGEIPWLMSGEVASRDIVEASKFITPLGLASSSAKIFPSGSVLVAMYGATAGEVGILRFPAATNQAVCAILPGDSHLPEYLYYYLLSVKPELVSQAIGNAQPNISQAKVKATEVPLPPLEEQKRIVARLDQAFAALDRARAHAEANIASARNLFGSILDATLSVGAEGWERRPLSALGKIQTGSTPKTSEPGNYGGNIPFIKPGDFKTDGSLVLDNEGLSQAGAARARRVPPGSALMVCIGATIGKAGFTDVEIVTNQQINAISPKSGISGEFLYYQFITPTFQREIEQRSGQATLPIVNKSKWSGIEVAIPSDKDIQWQAVRKLRAARRHTDDLIAGYQNRLSDIADLRQSLLQKAFSGQLT